MNVQKKIVTAFLGILTLLSACAPAPTLDVSAASTQVVATVYAAASQTAQFTPPAATLTPAPTTIPTATRDPNRTPPALPGGFHTTLLNPLDSPHTYSADTCQYLKAKWNPNNAAPGTVVMVIMFHSIPQEQKADSNQILLKDFRILMKDLKEQGFEAIDMQQMAGFLYQNAKIPPRSVLLIVDDRHYRQYFDEYFSQYYKEWGWKVINAWISLPETIQQLWDENSALEAEGWVDHQAHGVIHNINMNDSSTDEYIQGELQGSINAMQARFNKTPIAIIWPGGDFGKRPVEAARQYGYQLGFTINPRGPVMFNWIPQADAADPLRPSYLPEGLAADPLMTLPRYWAPDARNHLDTVRRIGNEAVAYAESNRAAELEYYDIVCAPTYGEITP
ncbi:MAG: hypothetical protein CO094_05455 [Anaerolineae bacterium CG_4_9_14_3_um_filter_57_17]|nr:MAG: hypothetical protein AUK01_00555 [Anaerolineae bacterium CG2_30_57_67]PJB66986.1 MAG: hypothetical protein CO094_05455 [Anaerolineae bacterium CG_4_9_14_3_um_filter_57_17]